MKKRRRTKNHLQFIYASVILFLSAAVLLPDMAEGTAADEYTERLVEAVETAKRDPRLMVEYMSYYADQADHRAELEESRAEGREEGLAALVETLKPILPDFETVYAAVIRNKVYSEYTREEVEKYYRGVE